MPKIDTSTQNRVTRYITQALLRANKTQSAIAREMGYASPNMITMIKNGVSKMPLAKVLEFCQATGADPQRLTNLCLQEYYPEVVQILKAVKTAIVTEDESDILALLREGDGALQVRNDDDRKAIRELGKRLRGS